MKTARFAVLSAGKRSTLRASVADPYLHGRNASEIEAVRKRYCLSTFHIQKIMLSSQAHHKHGNTQKQIYRYGFWQDGQDVALVTVELLDSEGRLVPNADLNVSFSVSGPGVVLGTTNGDPACHVPATSSRCPTFHGLLRAIVRSSALGAAGVVTVHVEGEGLGSTQVLLRAV